MPSQVAFALSALNSITQNNPLYIKRIIEAAMTGTRIVEPEKNNRFKVVLNQLKEEGILKANRRTPKEYTVIGALNILRED